MEVLRLGVKLELPVYTTATATPHLQVRAQLAATLDPLPTGQDHGSNMHLHGHRVRFFNPWSHIENSQ